MISLRETVKEWKTERDAYNFENLIREEIFNFVIVEAAKDAYTTPIAIESRKFGGRGKLDPNTGFFGQAC